jgi:hypothetical protein
MVPTLNVNSYEQGMAFHAFKKNPDPLHRIMQITFEGKERGHREKAQGMIKIPHHRLEGLPTATSRSHVPVALRVPQYQGKKIFGGLLTVGLLARSSPSEKKCRSAFTVGRKA